MITWRNSFARKPPNLLVSKPPNFNFGWLPTKFLILFGGRPKFLILVGGQPKFLKLVGEQRFLKFWSVANQNFWNWLVSNHFSNFCRCPTIISENSWWANIFQNLVGGQPNFLKMVGGQPICFSFILHKIGAVHTYFCQNRGCAHLFSAIFEHVHTYFSQLTGVHTYQIEFGRWPTKIFEIGRWATIFEILVGGQPKFLKLVGEQPFSIFGRTRQTRRTRCCALHRVDCESLTTGFNVASLHPHIPRFGA